MISALFEKLCPNCGGAITAERLSKRLPCERCLPEEVSKEDMPLLIKDGEMKYLFHVEGELSEWEKFFEERVGSEPWSLQRSWAKKVLLGRSFALLAPTGVGKTTFGVITASFFSLKGRRSYLILPTKILVEQVGKRIAQMGVPEDQLIVVGEASEKKKKEIKERLSAGRFSILVSTSMYLYKNHKIIPKDFDLIFIDDVDSFLKTAKNIDKVLTMLGFSEGDIEMAFRLIKLKEKNNKGEEDWKKIEEMSREVAELTKKAKGVLVVSSATGNPKSSRIKLFRELLGFEVGRPTLYLRNVVDLYEEVKDLRSILVERVRKLGKGGLVFVASDLGKEGVQDVVRLLEGNGIRAVSYEELRDFSEFERGDIDVLVGISSYRNPLARGIDLPHVVRYALFYGVPKISVSLNIESSVYHLLWALLSVRPLVAKNIRNRLKEVDSWIQTLRKYSFVSEEVLQKEPNLSRRIEDLREKIKSFLLSEEVRGLILSSEEITLRETENGYLLVVADVTGYLQASGRTSRMYAGGITKGLSYLLVEDVKAFNNLAKKVRWFNEEVRFKRADEENLDDILTEINEDRRKAKEILEGKMKIERKEHIKPVLIVVESPNKARTIANFFGKPVSRRFGDFEVLEVSVGNFYIMITASLGHVFDLIKEVGFHGVLIEKENFLPVYEIIENKEGVLRGLRLVAQEVENAYIATDPDTEGEKIGWDVSLILSPFVPNIKRIEFHEVTRRAISLSLQNPRDFDENLVKAQILRRVADRWVGFEVSRILQTTFHKSWLSGGRVQIPVLGWVIEREAEHKNKRDVVIVSLKGGPHRRLKLEFEFPNKEEAKKFFQELEEVEFEVLEVREESITPPPPYTTDTLLKDASERFKLSVKRTMEVAQELFERGYITYHRTDSTRVSDVGIGIAKEYLVEEVGEEYFYPRRWGEGGAHECIRPTKALDPEELRSLVLSGQVQDLAKDHLILYELIFNRFMASQMRPATVKIKKVKVKALWLCQELHLRTDFLIDGFNLLYPLELNPDLEGKVRVSDYKRLEKIPRAYLFTQGSLVEEMKKRGIGRPSTYAITIEKLLERGYIVEKNGFLIPTKLGKEVYKFLKKEEKILPFVSEEFTRKLEELMDEVEKGVEDYGQILNSLYLDIIGFKSVVKRN